MSIYGHRFCELALLSSVSSVLCGAMDVARRGQEGRVADRCVFGPGVHVGWICRPVRILLRSLTLAERIEGQEGPTYYNKRRKLTELTTKWENAMCHSAMTSRRMSKRETKYQMLTAALVDLQRISERGTSIDWRN